ncbi:hypothetical protein [Staphylococcus shinii]|uniref:hypothetical protein n=1 Tax=Staphylococcus shinii TaxID=2912228 RepID=UPI003EEB1F6F
MIKYPRAASKRYQSLKLKNRNNLDEKNRKHLEKTFLQKNSSSLKKINKYSKNIKLSIFVTFIIFFVLNFMVLADTLESNNKKLPIDFLAISITIHTLVSVSCLPKLFSLMTTQDSMPRKNKLSFSKVSEKSAINYIKIEIQFLSYFLVFYASFPLIYLVIMSYLPYHINLGILILAILMFIFGVCYYSWKLIIYIIKLIVNFFNKILIN